MSATTWSVRRTKRKTPSSSASKGKRVHISNDVGEQDVPASRRSREQSTLTRTQFITTPETSFVDEDGPVPKSKRPRRAPRHSTLTQMDWLNRAPPEESMLDEAMLPQADGTNDKPNRLKKRKSELDAVEETAKKSRRIQDDKVSEGVVTPGTSRRRSGRLARASNPTSPLVQDVGVFRKPSERSSKQFMKRGKDNIPQLEVADTFDNESSFGRLAQNIPSSGPQTPRRNVIPSSQSPESLKTMRKSVKKLQQIRSPSKAPRTPLAERSSNIQSQSAPRSVRKLNFSSKKGHPDEGQGLKISNKELLPRPSRAKGSDADIFDLPVTSSPRRSEEEQNRIQTYPKLSRPKAQELLEIPASSQDAPHIDRCSSPSVNAFDTQDTLPDIRDLIPIKKAQTTEVHFSSESTVILPHNTISVRDFCPRNQSVVKADDIDQSRAGPDEHEDTMLLDREPYVRPTLIVQDTYEVDSNLGSPIRNDTQFNQELLQRSSSPALPAMLPENKMIDSEFRSSSYAPVQTLQPATKVLGEVQNDSVEQAQSPLPTPRLVKHSTPTATRTSPDNKCSSRSSSPLSGLLQTSRTETTQIPLNDTIHSSSSPFLPPPPRPTTQTNLFPASLLRPSQMSTQEPTQRLFPSTAPGQSQWIQESNTADRITIKDSSSVPRPLSQIPRYADKSQTQGLDLDVIEDSEEEIDDLDLDPKAESRHSVRKPVPSYTSKTDSSLKSIHTSFEKQSGLKFILSSSPTRRESKRTSQTKSSSNPPSATPKARQSKTEIPESTTPPPSTATKRKSSLEELLDELSSESSGSPKTKRSYEPVPGYDNETQSNFTQNGHVSAAYLNRMRAEGLILPDWFTAKPYQLKSYRGAKRKEAESEMDDE